MIYIWVATGVASLARFLCHVISGVVFFSEYAGSQNPWVYSIVYNAPYIIASYIVSALLLTILYQGYSSQLVLKDSVNQTVKTI